MRMGFQLNSEGVLEEALLGPDGTPASSASSDPEALCDSSVKQTAGFFRLGEQKKNLFFWFFESRNAPATDPVFLWLTGGPGCSSSLALLAENGPCAVNHFANGTVPNPYSWNSNASILFVDSPPGTGFSTGTPDFSEEQVGKDLLLFLLAFFGHFEQFSANDLFVFGESYGGKWVPWLASKVNEHNKALGSDSDSDSNSNSDSDSNLQASREADGEDDEEAPGRINLQGIAIGNGLTKPTVQVKSYADMAFKVSLEGWGLACNCETIEKIRD